MYATGLVCANCGDSYPLEARFACDRCFGPVEPGYDNAAIRRERHAREDRGGAAHAVALRRPAARAPRRGRPARRLHAADPGAPPGRGARAARAVHQGRGRQPDPLVQGPRRLGRLREGRRARPHRAGLPVDRQPRRRRRRPGRRARARRLHLRAGRPGAGEDHRRVRAGRHGVRGRGQLRRRQPPLRRARLRAALGLRQRQRPRRTTRRARRRWRSRRPSSSAGGCPTRSWRRSPPARCSTRCTRATRS